MNFILFDDNEIRQNLFPITLTRPVAEIRVGIVTIKEKWEYFLKTSVSFLTENYLQQKFPTKFETENIYINSAVCPDQAIVEKIISLKENEKIIFEGIVIAFKTSENKQFPLSSLEKYKNISFDQALTVITQLWDIFLKNGEQLRKDFIWLTKNKISQPINDQHTKIYFPENIFIEEGVHIRAAILNAEPGPIYIGKNAIIQEGSIIRGAFAMLEGVHLNMGSKMRGDITIGPFCKVGGEVSNTVFFGYSNKSHEGFLGNSVVCEWCNFGADTNSSNMKNDYGNVKLWNYPKNKMVDTGRQFCGLIMGDHSKAGINTMFNTGTVVGVNCNVFGEGFPDNFVPSFSWGGKNYEKYRLEKALQVAKITMARRDKVFDDIEKNILEYIFQHS